MTENKDKKPTGVKPKRVKIDMDWEDAVGKALDKKRPKNGWPKDKKQKD